MKVITRTSGDVLISSTTYTYDPLDRRIARSVDRDGDGVARKRTQREAQRAGFQIDSMACLIL